jgi:transcriptional antiterminator RfaH
MEKWYVIYSKLHAERQVASHLQQQGYLVYLPTIPVAQARRDRPVDKPFFPGYLFFKYDFEALGITRIAYTPGLRGMVMFGGTPAVIAEGDVERIREQLKKISVWDKSGVPLKQGDAVEILNESFQDVDVVFDKSLTPTTRVRVLLRYLEKHGAERKTVERLIPLELDGSLVRKKDSRR